MFAKLRLVVATLTVVLLVVAAGLAALTWSGAYDVAADAPHSAPVESWLETMRERSIQARAGSIRVPALDEPARIGRGAGNYEAMCSGCHLAPGVGESELHRGLYPVPPALARERVEPGRAFWVIKHGIKASGMPAWGKSMDDEAIWDLAAFVLALPALDEAQYRDRVARSAGHVHGGADHDPGAGHGQGGAEDDAGAGHEHIHADGTKHTHRSASGAAADRPVRAGVRP